ncbi:hypothetical protein HGRIS_007229 [Hohenbuehelia grisea]|uniref:F-box domain-containing protein n=1 Tax=Hohenbuehelia grisea TaxID=104357 RepID=A0ABR3JBG2_9AGAR
MPCQASSTLLGRALDASSTYSQFADLPFEIVLTVLECLSPAELIQLARTSRAFHDFLKSTGADLVWERARMNASNVPRRPEHLTEYDWARLLCDGTRICKGCGGETCRSLDFLLLGRYCTACRESKLELRPQGSTDEESMELMTLIPSSKRSRSGREYCRKSDLSEIREALRLLKLEADDNQILAFKQSRKISCAAQQKASDIFLLFTVRPG